MVPFYLLSLTWRSIPHRRANKKGRNSHPGTFSSNANMLFRLIIYEENIENKTYIASTKKQGYPHFFKKKENNRRYCFKRPEILRTHWHTHTKENNEKLVLICSPSLYPSPRARSSGLLPQAASGTDGSR